MKSRRIYIAAAAMVVLLPLALFPGDKSGVSHFRKGLSR